MGENSGIQWTHHTFNPWVGCQRVSPGCVHCYAETYDKRVGGAVDPSDGVKKLRWGATAPRIRTTPANWKKPLKWNAAAAAAGERHRVFCSSLADVFEDRPELEPWRHDLFNLIDATPHLDWLLLTKRPENLARMLPMWRMHQARWPNVWLGTTVEDQQRANERIRPLLETPAVVRFLSMEPLIEPVDMYFMEYAALDWLIIGGESGPGARPFDTAWARSIVRWALQIGIPPFVKQMGANAVDNRARMHLADSAGGDMDEWPVDLRVREFPVPR